MLQIADVVQVELPCVVEVDPYVPFIFKTYDEVLPGPRYFQIGDFDRSLLEITIDRSSLIIRGVCLVGFHQVLTGDELREPRDIPEKLGLPVVSANTLVGDRTEEACDFGVCLGDGVFTIDWARTGVLDSVVRYQQLSFFLRGRELRRISVAELSSSQMAILAEHLLGLNS